MDWGQNRPARRSWRGSGKGLRPEIVGYGSFLRRLNRSMGGPLRAAHSLLPDHPLEFVFADNRHAQIAGLVELAPRFFARQHIVGLLAHAPAGTTAVFQNRRLD